MSGSRTSWGRSPASPNLASRGRRGPVAGLQPCLSALVLGAVLGQATAAAAGPWTPEPGHGYAKLWVKYHLGLEYQDGHGARREYGGAGYHELFANAYGEVGIVDGLAVWLHAPLLRAFWLGDARNGATTRHLAPGDPTFGLRWRLLRHGPLVGAFELGLRVPIAQDDPVQNLWVAEGAKAVRIGSLLVGNGVFDVPFALAFGYAWPRFYLAGSLSLTLRSGGYAPLAGWTLEQGWTFCERFSWRTRLRGQHTLGGEEATRVDSPSGVGDGTSFVGVAGELDYRFVGAWVVGLTLEGGLFAVHRQGRGPVFSLYVATAF